MNNIDIGQKFGKLTVIEAVDINKPHCPRKMYRCKCDCGNEIIVSGRDLIRGHNKSCGCEAHFKSGKSHPNYKHGDTGSRLYGIWCGMLSRCECSGNSSYQHYGAKGISVCPEWHEYINFKNWAENNGYCDFFNY